jgi:hypothetical protein
MDLSEQKDVYDLLYTKRLTEQLSTKEYLFISNLQKKQWELDHPLTARQRAWLRGIVARVFTGR